MVDDQTIQILSFKEVWANNREDQQLVGAVIQNHRTTVTPAQSWLRAS